MFCEKVILKVIPMGKVFSRGHDDIKRDCFLTTRFLGATLVMIQQPPQGPHETTLAINITPAARSKSTVGKMKSHLFIMHFAYGGKKVKVKV